MFKIGIYALLCLLGGIGWAHGADGPVLWNLDNLTSIGGLPVTVVGSPRVIETKQGKAIEFDGRDDAVYLGANPLAGLNTFTAEVVFRPATGGPKEQRFLHFQPDGGDDRVLFETRLPVEGRWFLDTYLHTSAGQQTLFADKFLHPIDEWYAAAIVVDQGKMRHYVNGQLELSADVPFKPLAAGQTSIGVRFNKVHWFQGAIRQIRITPQALEPAAMLRP
ncbi:MAG: LamG domain-containing protein [Planctomycetaceae bacterium]|nr:LamG domain-containing protein [Planctomycetaceae bacterium]